MLASRHPWQDQAWETKQPIQIPFDQPRPWILVAPGVVVTIPRPSLPTSASSSRRRRSSSSSLRTLGAAAAEATAAGGVAVALEARRGEEDQDKEEWQ